MSFHSANLENFTQLSGSSIAQTLFVLSALWAGYRVLVIAWNISPFHPLYKIPGPRLAAATYLPEFYYDTIKYGRYTKQIQKMHEKYGTSLFAS